MQKAAPSRVKARRVAQSRSSAMSGRKPTPPPTDALTWAADAVGPRSRVVRVRRLIGGIDSVVHALLIEDARGHCHELVLRRRVGEDISRASKRIAREATVLTVLAATSIHAPRLVAADADGTASGGTSSILMTRLPGHIHLAPSDPELWLQEQVHCLASLHSLSVDLPDFKPWFLAKPVAVPPWTFDPTLWQRAITLVRGHRAPFTPRLVHGDFQHFNVLWQRNRISGVVDWTDAGRGPAETDVAHCCLNLAVLFGPDWAERFRQLYAAEAGYPLNAWWEVASLMRYLPGWDEFVQVQAGRRAVVDLAGMHARVEKLLERTLRRT
jgi:aminoglycoside phosphotransferase (APT) family kinase protein